MLFTFLVMRLFIAPLSSVEFPTWEELASFEGISPRVRLQALGFGLALFLNLVLFCLMAEDVSEDMLSLVHAVAAAANLSLLVTVVAEFRLFRRGGRAAGTSDLAAGGGALQSEGSQVLRDVEKGSSGEFMNVGI
jgi:hypothetical protein